MTFTALFALLLGGHQPFAYITHRLVDVGIGVATGLAVNVLVFPPLQLRPAEQARRAARNARESLRWNLRPKPERAVPRPDTAVLDSLENLTARTRAAARSLPDIEAVTGPSQDRVSFGQDYAAMLRILAGLVRQLADLRSSLPRAALTAARDCQRQLERETAQLPDHSDARSAAQHLTRLTSEIISEVAEHQATGDDPAGHRDKCHHRGGGDDTAVRDLSG